MTSKLSPTEVQGKICRDLHWVHATLQRPETRPRTWPPRATMNWWCWGTFSLRGACVTVNIQNAIFHIVVAEEDDNHHNPVPRIFLMKIPTNRRRGSSVFDAPMSRSWTWLSTPSNAPVARTMAGSAGARMKTAGDQEIRGRGRGMSLFRGISTHQTDDDRY